MSDTRARTGGCRVRGCTSPMEAIFDRGTPKTGPWEIGVCLFHRSAVDAGAYTFDEESNELLLGADAPPSVMSWKVTSEWHDIDICHLTLGRNGVEEETVSFILDASVMQEISQFAQRRAQADDS